MRTTTYTSFKFKIFHLNMLNKIIYTYITTGVFHEKNLHIDVIYICWRQDKAIIYGVYVKSNLIYHHQYYQISTRAWSKAKSYIDPSLFFQLVSPLWMGHETIGSFATIPSSESIEFYLPLVFRHWITCPFGVFPFQLCDWFSMFCFLCFPFFL